MKKILLLFLFCSSVALYGQENIALQFDKNFYVLGENIWFSAYLSPDNSSAQKAQQLRIAITDKEGNVKKSTYLPITNGSVSGMIPVPLDWKEGRYMFHAFTVWNPNPTIKNSTSVALPIYNDFNPDSYREKDFASKSTLTKPAGELIGKLKTNKMAYQRKENIEVNVSTANANGTISVAVISNNMMGNAPALKEIQKNFSTSNNQKPEALHTFYGQIETTKTSLGIGVHFLKDNKIQWVSVDGKGIFTVENKLGLTQSTQVVGLFNNEKNKTYTTPVNSIAINWTKDLPKAEAKPLPMNDYLRTYLRQSQQRKKYKEVFGVEKPVLVALNTTETKAFQPDVTYNLGDYTSMTTVEEFMQEVIPFVKVKSKKAGREVRMFNELKDYTKANPVYLVDGWLMYDQAKIFELPIAAIKSIAVFRDTKTLKNQFGILGNNGVISISTRKKDKGKVFKTAKNVLTSQGVLNKATFKTAQPKFNKMPNFRSLIYWKDNLELKNGKAIISFPHTDDLGVFSIIIKGLTADGKLIKGQTNYKVK